METLALSTHTHTHTHTHTYTHTHTHTHTHARNDCSRNWVLILAGVEILWEEEGFQFGVKRWQGWAEQCLRSCGSEFQVWGPKHEKAQEPWLLHLYCWIGVRISQSQASKRFAGNRGIWYLMAFCTSGSHWLSLNKAVSKLGINWLSLNKAVSKFRINSLGTFWNITIEFLLKKRKKGKKRKSFMLISFFYLLSKWLRDS